MWADRWSKVFLEKKNVQAKTDLRLGQRCTFLGIVSPKHIANSTKLWFKSENINVLG